MACAGVLWMQSSIVSVSLPFWNTKPRLGWWDVFNFYCYWWSKYVKAHFKLEDILCGEGWCALCLGCVQTFHDFVFIQFLAVIVFVHNLVVALFFIKQYNGSLVYSVIKHFSDCCSDCIPLLVWCYCYGCCCMFYWIDVIHVDYKFGFLRRQCPCQRSFLYGFMMLMRWFAGFVLSCASKL